MMTNINWYDDDDATFFEDDDLATVLAYYRQQVEDVLAYPNAAQLIRSYQAIIAHYEAQEVE